MKLAIEEAVPASGTASVITAMVSPELVGRRRRQTSRTLSGERDEERNHRKETKLMAKEVNAGDTQQDGRRYYSPIQKEDATFLETSEETGGENTPIEMEVDRGDGPCAEATGLDRQHFEVLEGTLELLVGGDPLPEVRGEGGREKNSMIFRSKPPTTVEVGIYETDTSLDEEVL
jgi:hypothetical protein